jgi:hypothetical protein
LDLAQIKTENDAFLRSRGVPVNSSLPLIEDVDAVHAKPAQVVAKRLCAMGYIIRSAYGMPLVEVNEWIGRLDLGDALSSEERAALASGDLSEQHKINFGWLAEGAQVLAWSLGLAELDHFRQCDDDLANKAPFKAAAKSFVASARLVPLAAIQRQADLLYRMHWATVDARLNGTECPLHEGLIRERRRAIDWVYGVAEDWDDVPLDT